MKLNIKAITAVVALTCAGSASAAINVFSTGNGELFLSVRDNINATSIVLDMNTTIDTFLGTTSVAGTGGSDFAMTDAAVANFMTTGSGDYSWAVMAGDSVGSASAGGLRYLSTTNAADTTIGTLNNFTLQNWSIMEGSYLLNVNPFIDLAGPSTTLKSTSADNSYFITAFDSWSNNANFTTTAAAGQSQNFMFLSNSQGTIFPSGKLAKVDFVKTGSFTLQANGTLNYVSAVPLPAAVYFLGSALVGLVGVTRRRNKAA